MTLPNDNLPVRIDRAALDRIIQRATELQTGEREVGDNLTPDEVLALGRDVGIPAKYLEQAMLEHRSEVAVEADNSPSAGCSARAWSAPSGSSAANRTMSSPRSSTGWTRTN
ncbi:MAG: hypothetical protein R2882_02025 [Gemmatimonadales bacterium]